MIDIENLVFDTVFNQLSVLHPEANITVGYDEKIASFPTIMVRQVNSQPYRDSATDDCSENHARVTFEIEVYSDKETTGRTECKDILADADEIMQSMKFRRIHLNRPLNVDRTLWRQYARYEVIVAKGREITEIVDGEPVVNTVFDMYRR
jgi:hypothetical protein